MQIRRYGTGFVLAHRLAGPQIRSRICVAWAVVVTEPPYMCFLLMIYLKMEVSIDSPRGSPLGEVREIYSTRVYLTNAPYRDDYECDKDERAGGERKKRDKWPW